MSNEQFRRAARARFAAYAARKPGWHNWDAPWGHDVDDDWAVHSARLEVALRYGRETLVALNLEPL